MLFDSESFFDCGVLLPFSSSSSTGTDDDGGTNNNNNMCYYFPGTRIEDEDKENVVSSSSDIVATARSSSSSSSSTTGVQTTTTTKTKATKYQETHTTFGRKGCGLHKEHHLWKNCKPLPKDLVPNEILVKIIDPMFVDDDTQISYDDTILELAMIASNTILKRLRKTYSARDQYDARFILKLKVTTISDGSINGSISTNRPTISSYGYAGIGVIWKLCSNELTTTSTGFELQHHNNNRNKNKHQQLSLDTTTTEEKSSSSSSSYSSNFDHYHSSYDDDNETEIPYEPLPYDGGFEVIEQSLDYMQLFSTKSIGNDIVLKQLVPDICSSIMKRINVKKKPSFSSSSCNYKSHHKANNNATMLRLVTNTTTNNNKNNSNKKSTTTKRPLVPSFLTECEV